MPAGRIANTGRQQACAAAGENQSPVVRAGHSKRAGVGQIQCRAVRTQGAAVIPDGEQPIHRRSAAGILEGAAIEDQVARGRVGRADGTGGAAIAQPSNTQHPAVDDRRSAVTATAVAERHDICSILNNRASAGDQVVKSEVIAVVKRQHPVIGHGRVVVDRSSVAAVAQLQCPAVDRRCPVVGEGAGHRQQSVPGLGQGPIRNGTGDERVGGVIDGQRAGRVAQINGAGQGQLLVAAHAEIAHHAHRIIERLRPVGRHQAAAVDEERAGAERTSAADGAGPNP